MSQGDELESLRSARVPVVVVRRVSRDVVGEEWRVVPEQ